jgi:hypothetical protein
MLCRPVGCRRYVVGTGLSHYSRSRWIAARPQCGGRELESHARAHRPHPETSLKPKGPELDAPCDALTDPQCVYLAAVRDTRDRDAGCDRFPSYKFSSNEGWLITSERGRTPTQERQDIEDEITCWNGAGSDS